MSQRMLPVTLNTGRMSVQSPDVGWPVTLRVLRSRVARLLNRPPSVHPPWLRLPVPFVPFELTDTQDSAAPLFFVWRGWEKQTLVSFAVGTNSAADADLWEVIHRLGRAELPRRPVPTRCTGRVRRGVPPCITPAGARWPRPRLPGLAR